MDLIDSLLEDHKELRDSLNSIERLLGKRTGVGLDDRSSVDRGLLSRALYDFLSKFREHDALEEMIIARLLRLEARLVSRQKNRQSIAPALHASIFQSHRSLEMIAHILGAVTASHDSDNVYSIRRIVSHVREELNKHFIYEEQDVFPKLREILTPKTLDKIDRQTRSILGA